MHTAATRVISMEWDWEFKESFKASNPLREVGEDGPEPSNEDRTAHRKQAIQAEVSVSWVPWRGQSLSLDKGVSRE